MQVCVHTIKCTHYFGQSRPGGAGSDETVYTSGGSSFISIVSSGPGDICSE